MTHRTGRRLIGALLAALLTVTSVITAFAATTSIGTDASRPEYFEALGGSGNYNPLKTPYHYDKTTGDVAYCIEHEKDSPSSSAEYELFDASTVYSQTTISGIQAILDNGYPANDGGLSAEQAHYATANAIRTWMKESADIGYNFMIPEDEHIHPVSGSAAQETWEFFLQLISCARSGAVAASSRAGGTVQFYPRNPEWTIQGDTLYTQIEVQSSNGYTLARSSTLVNISGYTGGTYDVLDITAPASLLNETVQLQFTALGGSSSGVHMDWYRPTSASSQNIVVARMGSGSGGGTGEQRVVTITAPEITTVDLIVIKKDGSDGSLLDGAVFMLTDASGAPVGLTQTAAGRYTAGGSTTQFTTSNGTAVITGLQAGTYTLTEVSPPTAGYAQMQPETLQLTASATVTVTNVPTEVTIVKVDGRTEELLAWMQFRLLDENGSRVLLQRDSDNNYRPDANGSAEMFTDANGSIRIIGLPQGTYSVEESQHEGYAPLSESPQFTLTAYAEITITNEPLTVQLHKTDGGTGEDMAGIEFELLDDNGDSVFVVPLDVGEYQYAPAPVPASVDFVDPEQTLTTNSDGLIRIYNIPEGSYTQKEITDLTAQGYTPSQPITFSVTSANGLSDPVLVEIVNDPTMLLLTKSDSATREPLDGATFRIKDADGTALKLSAISSGNYRPDVDGEETFTTKNGETYIRYLTAGTYTIEEVSAPTGYTPDAPKTITLSLENNSTNPARVNLQNTPLAIRFLKLDAEDDSPLDDCTFSLKDASGKVIPLKKTSNGVYTPDKDGDKTFTTQDGEATIVRIDPGEYIISEVTPAEGYSKAEDVSFTVTAASTANNPLTVTMRNKKLALRITKVDADTRQTLSGAVFMLKNDDGDTLRISPVFGKADTYEVSATGGEVFTIPKSGSVTILKVPVGNYELIEKTAPVGYALSDKAETITIENSNTLSNPAQVVFENHTLAVQVTKTNGLTGERLAGVRFRIESLTGVAVRVKQVSDGVYRTDPADDMGFVTDANGVATILGIAQGTYNLVEENNPGFGRVEPVQFTVTNESTMETPTVIGVENQPLELEITKVDSRTLEPLTGVPFRLTDSKGSVLKFTQQPDGTYHLDENGLETLLTDAQGKILVRYIPAGTVILSEDEYLGYSIGKPVEIEITNEHIVGAPCKVTVENKPIAMEITKTDLLTRKPMESVTFEILGKDEKALAFIKQESGIWYPAKEGETGTTKLLTDKNGIIRIEYLPQGDYTLVEQQVTGYALPEPIPFTITSAHTQEEPLHLSVQNLPTRLIIEKQDSVTNKPLTGAVFTLTGKDGKPISLVKQENGTYHPAGKDEKGITEIPMDENGLITVEYLPSGKYTVTEVTAPVGYGKAEPIETEVGTELVRQTVNGAQAVDENGNLSTNPLGETSLAVLDHPLALRILKIHSISKRPLSGAEFRIMADGNLSQPLTFRQENGVLWCDPKGTITTITLDKNCTALLYGLPAGKYHLEESKVPDGFFPIAPVACTLTLENTSQAPLEITISNAPSVKLGLDTDKYNVVIALAVLLVTLSIFGTIALRRHLRKNQK